MDSHNQIEDEVAEWLARRDSGNWSEDDEARLQQWVAASIAHRVAYLRLKSTWDTAARLRALRAGQAAGTSERDGVPPPGEWRRSPFFEQSAGSRKQASVDQDLGAASGDTTSSFEIADSDTVEVSVPRRGRRRLSVALAASLALLVVASFGAYRFWAGAGDRYATAVGGFASVPMTDGSKITLNTDSEIRVAITEKERRIDLEQGEAFFEVAHDKTRPFVVRAGNRRVIAVGTKFSVRHLGEDVRVLVTEGEVRVESSSRATADNSDADTVLLAAGDIARAADSAVVVHKAPLPQVEELLSWREGYLRFHETALGDVVEEMNRYNTRKILIEDPKLATVKISGTFRPTQYEAFVRVLQDGFSIHAQSQGDRITLTQQP